MKIARQWLEPAPTEASLFGAGLGLALVFLSLAAGAADQNLGPDSRSLPPLLQLELKGLHVRGDSPAAAWRGIGSSVRTVLVLSEDQTADHRAPFSFRSEKSTVDQLLQAFRASYPGYAYTQDRRSGVVWLHPQTAAYDTLLGTRVKVPKEMKGLPMLSVLDSLAELLPSEFQVGGRRTANVRNTFNYAVDLPEGVYSVRDIINLCCAAHPANTFYVSKSPHGHWEITPINLGYAVITNPSPYAVQHWRTSLGSTSGAVPTEREIIQALASPDGFKKNVARAYLDMNQDEVSFQRLFAEAQTPEESIWTAVGVLAVMVRTDEATHTLSIGKIKEALAKSGGSIAPGLEALATLLIAVDPVDTADLERMAKRPLSQEDLALVKYDITRILRYSTRIRNKLQALDSPWAGFSRAEIEALERTVPLSLP